MATDEKYDYKFDFADSPYGSNNMAVEDGRCQRITGDDLLKQSIIKIIHTQWDAWKIYVR